jgi:hypothetical protein
MDTKDLRGLMEAYSSVYAPQEEISEGIKKIYHKIAAKHHERQADKAFGKGDSERFQRHTGRSMVHRLDAGEKIAQVRNPEKFREYEKKMRTKKEELDIFDAVLEFLQVEGYAETLEEAQWIMANVIDEEIISVILGEEILNELSNRKLRAYVKKSSQSHQAINKKWDQGTATEKEKLKSIGHEIGQERAYRKMDKRAGR